MPDDQCDLCYGPSRDLRFVHPFSVKKAVLRGFNPITNERVDLSTVKASTDKIGRTLEQWWEGQLYGLDQFKPAISRTEVEEQFWKRCPNCEKEIHAFAFPRPWWKFW